MVADPRASDAMNSHRAGLLLALGPELFLWQRDELYWDLLPSCLPKCHSMKCPAKVVQSQLSKSRWNSEMTTGREKLLLASSQPLFSPQEPPTNTAVRTLHRPPSCLSWASPVPTGLRRFKEKASIRTSILTSTEDETEPRCPLTSAY